MTQTLTKTSHARGTRGGKLPAKPIMIYPSSPEEREAIKRAAAACRQSVSAFVMDSSLQASKAMMANPSLAERRVEMDVRSQVDRSEGVPPQAVVSSPSEPTPLESPAERAKRLTDKILGLMEDEIAAYGGTEAFMRWVRSDEDQIA